MLNRRKLLKRIGSSVGACSLSPFLMQLEASAEVNQIAPPSRFVFVIRSNGVLCNEILPQGVDWVKERPHPTDLEQPHDVSLVDRKLGAGLAALENYKQDLTLIQGLSGRMCSGNHEAGFGALGAYSGKRTPRDETIDWALARHMGGIIPHLGFTMDHFGSSVTYPNLSASGPRKPLPYYADPTLAYTDLFGSIAVTGASKSAFDVDRNLLDYMVADVKRYQRRLSSGEKEKMEHYLNGFEMLRERQAKLRAMQKELIAAAPELSDSFTSEVETEQLRAHFDLAASSLIAGLTQVCTIRCEHLDMRLSGLGMKNRTVHEIGHMIENGPDGNTGEAFEGDASTWGEFKTRETIMKFHMELLADLYAKLKAVPERDGTMADHTVIIYFSDHGDRHHSPFYLWPMIVLGTAGNAFRSGRYIQYPGHKLRGNQTLGNFYLSLLHAAGDQRKSFGQLDLESPDYINQELPLSEWMT